MEDDVEPFWVKELREVLVAAGREDLMMVILKAFQEVQKNAAWTCASASKGHLKNAVDEVFAVWLEGRIPGWAEDIVNKGSHEEKADGS